MFKGKIVSKTRNIECEAPNANKIKLAVVTKGDVYCLHKDTKPLTAVQIKSVKMPITVPPPTHTQPA
jgi:hypothetical protein